ncbi:MAG: SRPBCC domain-containing protein [Alphaproteobacteria bacterium]|nr:SRPBCC domain-containing protein [Alphaproteobacteria bacterium]
MKSSLSAARAVADLNEGAIYASVEIAAPPDRVFRALASEEIVNWWVNPGIFDTRDWTGDVRVGGRWRASGVARGEEYVLEGEFLEVEPPRRLVHTWQRIGSAMPPSTLEYRLDAIEGGTRITLKHCGFVAPQVTGNNAVGWETSFAALVALLER